MTFLSYKRKTSFHLKRFFFILYNFAIRKLFRLMKKVFFTLLSLFTFSCLTASAKGDDGKKDSIDCVMYRVSYNTKSVNDTTKLDSLGHYRYGDDLMRLDIGTKVSKFYSYTYVQAQEYFQKAILTGSIDMKAIKGKVGTLKWTLYRNDPEGFTSVYDFVYSDNYRIKEPTQTPQWRIVADSVKTILNYKCTMAVTDFKGRRWTAWYTEDIPISQGPWKLIGLPGLILSARDSEKQFVFEASGLEQINGKEAIVMMENARKYEDTTQQKFDKMKRTTSPLDGSRGLRTAIITANGKTDSIERNQKLKASLSRTRPYNPLER